MHVFKSITHYIGNVLIHFPTTANLDSNFQYYYRFLILCFVFNLASTQFASVIYFNPLLLLFYAKFMEDG